MKKIRYKKAVIDYKDIIYNQAFYFTGNKEDAEDITQEVLLRLWHHFNNIKRTSLKAWIMKVTRNLCIDYSRRKKEVFLMAVNDNDRESTIWENLPDERSNPENEVINIDLKEHIAKTIKRLPEKIGNIVIMRDIQDLKYEQIAEVMELPLNSVKVYLHRGRKLLLKNLSHYYKNYKSDFNLE